MSGVRRVSHQGGRHRRVISRQRHERRQNPFRQVSSEDKKRGGRWCSWTSAAESLTNARQSVEEWKGQTNRGQRHRSATVTEVDSCVPCVYTEADMSIPRPPSGEDLLTRSVVQLRTHRHEHPGEPDGIRCRVGSLQGQGGSEGKTVLAQPAGRSEVESEPSDSDTNSSVTSIEHEAASSGGDSNYDEPAKPSFEDSDDPTEYCSSLSEDDVTFEEPGSDPSSTWLEGMARQAHAHHQRIFNSSSRDDVQFIQQGERLAALGPREAHRLRKRNWKLVRRMSRALKPKDEEAKRQLDPEIRSVLEAAGDTGSHIAFLDWALKASKYRQRREIMRDVKFGFGVVGIVNVEKSARSRVVQRRSIKPEELPSGKAEWEKTRRIHAQMAKGNDPSVNEEIWQQTTEEQRLGRITPFYEPDVEGPVPTRRFGVRQLTSDGRQKTRCIDDAKASELNRLISVLGRIRMGRLQDVVKTAKILHASHPEEDLYVWKADFKSAYRGLALRPGERHLLQILVWDPSKETSRTARQKAMPFGATAAVYAWDRLSHALWHIVQFFGVVSGSKYVDDLFGCVWRFKRKYFRRMILDLVTRLGYRLAEDKTPEACDTQVILGVEAKLVYKRIRGKRRLYIKTRVDEPKARHWSAQLGELLRTRRLEPEEAEQLAGRLNFVCGAVAGAAGAVRLKSIYRASYRKSSSWSPELESDVKWWHEFMSTRHVKTRPISEEDVKRATFFTDASGSGGLGACVLAASAGLASVNGVSTPSMSVLGLAF